MDNLLLNTDALSVGYHGKALIGDICLSLNRGEIVTLIGPNGSGKSTILKTIIRQLPLVKGSISLEDQDMKKMTGNEIARKMSVLMTQKLQTELMTCEDVVSTGRYPYTGKLGILSQEDKKIVWDCLKTVDAEDLADRDFNAISDGQRQRILLARALCQEPEIIILDEPTSFLDMRHKLQLLSILKNMVTTKHIGVLMSLHELDLAQKISDTVVCVRGDRIDKVGKPEEVFSSDYIAQLYEVEKGSYDPLFGSVEMPAITGKPEVFVIAGGGTGIPVYRKLQRKGIPFATGILWKNDVDYGVARMLAVDVAREQSYEPLTDAVYQRALELMEQCKYVVCVQTEFGTWNACNRLLKEKAMGIGKLVDITEIEK